MTEQPASPAPPAGLPRWAKIALGLSLGANLLVVGAVAGAFLAHPGPWRAGGPFAGPAGPGRGEARQALRVLGPMGLRIYAEALPRGELEALAGELRARAPELRAARAELEAAMDALIAALRAAPFNPVAARAALDRQAAIAGQMAAEGAELLAGRIAAMTPQARAAFADALERRARHLRERRGGPRREE